MIPFSRRPPKAHRLEHKEPLRQLPRRGRPTCKPVRHGPPCRLVGNGLDDDGAYALVVEFVERREEEAGVVGCLARERLLEQARRDRFHRGRAHDETDRTALSPGEASRHQDRLVSRWRQKQTRPGRVMACVQARRGALLARGEIRGDRPEVGRDGRQGRVETSLYHRDHGAYAELVTAAKAMPKSAKYTRVTHT